MKAAGIGGESNIIDKKVTAKIDEIWVELGID